MGKQVVILGGGFAGLLTALTASKIRSEEAIDITLINRTPSHQIVTELHRLAAGGISEAKIALPLEKLVRGKPVQLKVDTVVSISPDQRIVSLSGGDVIEYDALVIALGSETAFYGIPGLEEQSFTLKSIEDANRINAHIESRIEAYGRSGDKADATIVIGGGGLTGIELIGELVDLLPRMCVDAGIDANCFSLICVEAGPSILPGFASALTDRAKISLENRGVTILTGNAVTEVQENRMILKDGTEIVTNTIIWTGGVTGSSVVINSGIDVARGRAIVNDYLQSASHPNVFVAGDSALVKNPDGRPYPPSAQLAWQMGETAGYNLCAYLGNLPMRPFQPTIAGTLASLGRKDAIGTVGPIQLRGMPASLMKEAGKIRYLSHIKALNSLWS